VPSQIADPSLVGGKRRRMREKRRRGPYLEESDLRPYIVSFILKINNNYCILS